ncbi:MAG: type II toxin-antitoxin system VapC family toxin [Gemmatimonadales bacterium]|nr:MAG: type II toxin-antitoxin system VapC family toxin [Gemmatimonadales bacterium]
MSQARYLLDTNICIYIINMRPMEVLDRFKGLKVGQVALSSITGVELSFGVEKSGSIRNRRALDKFLAPLDVLAFDEAAMRAYGPLRAHLEGQGTPIGAMDMLIAAQALAVEATLVTDNAREFQRVPGLVLENWVATGSA